MTFWPLTNSNFPTDQTFHQFHDLDAEFDLHRVLRGFHGAFAMGVACQQGTLTLADTWFRLPILGLACAPIVETRFLELAMSLLDFSLRIPLGTFSILLDTRIWIRRSLDSTMIEPFWSLLGDIAMLAWWIRLFMLRVTWICQDIDGVP